MADAGDLADHQHNAIPADKREAYEELIAHRKEWLHKYDPTLNKAQRKAATEMAFNIMLSGEENPERAVQLGCEQVRQRLTLQDQMGRDLVLSSETEHSSPARRQENAPDPARAAVGGQQMPEQAAAAEQAPADEQAPPVADKGKGKAKRLPEDSDSGSDGKAKKTRKSKPKKKKAKRSRSRHDSDDPDSSSSDSDSDSSSSDSSSSSSSSSSEDSDSDSDSGSKRKRKRKSRAIDWKKGKINDSSFGQLRVSDKIAAQVQKNKFVDLWHFTPAACAQNLDDKPVTHTWKVEGATLTSTEKPKPRGFVPDHQLTPVDFLHAIDTWADTMKAEGISEKTIRAWKRFNKKIRKHSDWKDEQNPHLKVALQTLHHFQRESFATKTRQEKARKRAIKERYPKGEKRDAALKKLDKFDPSAFPTKEYTKIEKQVDRSEMHSIKNRTPPPPAPLVPAASAPVAAPDSPTTRSTALQSSSPSIPLSRPTASTARMDLSSRGTGGRESAPTTTPTLAPSQPAPRSTSAACAATTSALPSGALTPKVPRLPANLQLNAEGWECALQRHGLANRYPTVAYALREGLPIGIPPISSTYIAKHLGSALKEREQVSKLINNELASGRYVGPFSSAAALEQLIGPFQTSPLGIRQKANGKFRLIQDFSHPHDDNGPGLPRGSKYLYRSKQIRVDSKAFSSNLPSFEPQHDPSTTRSINSQLRVQDWPTTWYTTDNMCRAILMLPHTAQAFVRDTVSAFRQIPLHKTQWPGTVIEWEGKFYLDRFLAFGLGPACGAYGLFGDGLADLAREEGIVPNGHWVDDNAFFRFRSEDLDSVNNEREKMRERMQPYPIHDHGRTYWLDDEGNKHAEDYSCVARVLDGAEDGYNCSLADIDRLSAELGWPWAPEKDAPWASVFTYGGLTFNIATRELSCQIPKFRILEYYLSNTRHTQDVPKNVPIPFSF
ncbi:hypothetical protein CF319_g8313, partial [Tilletia indica]